MSLDYVYLEKRDNNFKLSFKSGSSIFSKIINLDQMRKLYAEFNNLLSSEKDNIEEVKLLMGNSYPEFYPNGRRLDSTYEEVKWKDDLGCQEARDFRAKTVTPLQIEENW